MALHKMVNGVRVDCTPEEEEQIKSEWAANTAKAQERIKEKKAKAAKEDKLKKSAMLKLKAVGLDVEEIAALLGKPALENEGG